MQVRLLEDITTGKGKKLKYYGKKGEIVTVISDHMNVLIVNGKEAFPVIKEKTEIYENSQKQTT